MILPVMMRSHDKVDWTLSFVGTPTENDGVDCKHGPSECKCLFFRSFSFLGDPPPSDRRLRTSYCKSLSLY